MIKYKYRKKIALLLLTITATNIVAPACFALTSGPVQPEVTGFQPAGVSDMVDLFSGDFKYNIPLLDVDGYPVNLNYQSGVGMDDEASWVGLGWNVNVGSINRTVRGLPDDFSGDNVTTDHFTKPKITVGGQLRAKAETRGNGKLIGGNGSFTVGVFNDNYTGIGAQVGANAGITAMSGVSGGALTAGLGLGILSSTSGGVDVTPSINLGMRENYDDKITGSAGLSASLGYNTRSGMKSLTLGGSFGISANYPTGKVWLDDMENNGIHENVAGSTISFNTEPVYPKIQVPYNTTYGSFSLDVGGVVGIFFLSGGVTGYKSVTKIDALTHTNPAFGFLYAENGKDKTDALMDFIREKENPIIPDLPDLPIPVQMPDMFLFTNQSDGGQFRLYRGGSGAFFDNQVTDKSTSTTIGADYGFGLYDHAGVTYFNQNTHNTTRKWTADNQYIKKADFQTASTTQPNRQHVYFKRIGEKTAEDVNMTTLLHDTLPLAVSINGKTAQNGFTTTSLDTLQKTNRQINRTTISYLTAKEAALAGLDKKINSYAFNDSATFSPPANHLVVPQTTIDRYSTTDAQNYRQPHHISEITVTDDAGKRSVYGIPVYNIEQNEYSFAVGITNDTINNNQVKKAVYQNGDGTINYNKGIDQYYQHDKRPAYASAFLLTAVLSPDYVDKTGDGITPDDLGTAIKFNYSKISSPYQWRTPYQNATLNKCQLADRDDDKASIVYGKKELWYVHSIETKTKIAYFITTDRLDGLGVLNLAGDQDQGTRQKRLTEIRLYSKSDMTRPIKVVKFEYNYELCPGVPNSLAAGNGKLTLKKVYFEYGNTTKGKYHPYLFSYAGASTHYGNVRTDRWGIYKPDKDNAGTLDNEQYPYTNQDFDGSNKAKTKLDQYAANWHLNKIDLPTGGTINVTYESDDYAYVQNKQAMAMVSVVDLISDRTGQHATSLITAQGFKIARQETDAAPANPVQWFKDTYLNGADYIYTKFRINVSTTNSITDPYHYYDYIPCYAKIKDVNVVGTNIMVVLENRTDGGVTNNPIVFSAWQTMKNEYPRYAYPGFDRRIGDGSSSIASAVTAIANAVGDLSELKQNFYQKANKRGYAGQADLPNSYVRVTKVNGYKLGGGVRVKKIQITDNWPGMAGNNNTVAGVYGQQYDYTTTENNKTISSGVAAYEPTLGNDENPLHQPVPYIQSIKGSISNFFDLEEPFGESFFPGASVGYSKVTVTDLNNSGQADPIKRTGYIVNEFYTAKDFPVRVNVLPLTKTAGDQNKNSYNFLGSTAIQEAVYSQGYSLILNDMHGKAKATRVFNQSGSEISSTVYYYKSRNTGTNEMELVNNVDVVDQTGSITKDQVIGRDIEFFTDFREQESQNSGTSIDIGVDIIPAFWIPIPIPHWPTYNNSEYKLFRSACGVKVSQYYGIIDKVVKTVNGSSITTQNMVFDKQTGEPVVTHTQNEFNKDIYSVNMPAYWVYNGMGGAYQNAGIIASDFQTDANGVIASPAYNSYLQPGDEITNMSATTANTQYWVIATPTGTGRMLIDRTGARVVSFNIGKSVLVKFTRSGFRNILGASTSSVVCLNNPVSVIQGKLQLVSNTDLTSLKVINASATTYDESWGLKEKAVAIPPPSSPIPIVVNTSRDFTFSKGDTLNDFAQATFQKIITISGSGVMVNDTVVRSQYWGTYQSNNQKNSSGRISEAGIWPTAYVGKQLIDSNYSEKDYTGFDTLITFPQSKVYYFGMASRYNVEAYLDCAKIYQLECQGCLLYEWYMTPMYVTAGKHLLHASFKMSFVPGGNVTTPWRNEQFAGYEIYNNTRDELIKADAKGTGINIIFSTKNFRNNNKIADYFDLHAGSHDDQYTPGQESYHFTKPDGTPLYYNYCSQPIPPNPSVNVRNPYIIGFLGNWRPYQTKVFQQNRNYAQVAANHYGVNVKDAGYINNFSAYWYNNSNAWVTDNVGNRARWVNANSVSLYDKYGQQLENKDALGRYSAARFDFNGELPSAVASNAMNRDIYASSFEDVMFKALNSSADSTIEFTQSSGASISPLINSTVSHSGNYSLLISSSGIKMTSNLYTLAQKTQPYLDRNTNGEYVTKSVVGLYPQGFEPNPAKKYIFNAWVKDSSPTTTTVPIQILLTNTNSTSYASVNLTCKAIVEGWKLVEGTIDFSALGTTSSFTMYIFGTSIYIDDIRMHPFDAHLKSYAYDDATMRLMAELDENCFATFYEYDDEGLLIRVKKETERGIMTLKETRSSYKKQP